MLLLLLPGVFELIGFWETAAFISPTAAFAPLPAATPTGAILSDDFNDNLGPPSQTTTWLLGYLNDPTDPNTQVQETGGQLHITPMASDDFQHNGYLSTASYNFTGAAASVEVVQATSGGGAAETYFYVGVDINNWLRIVKSGDGNLYFQVKAGGLVRRTTVLTYNNLQHRRWRIRHNAGSDSIYFETSADGANWTVRDTAARPFSLAAMKINLAAGVFVSTPLPGEAIFDNFLLEPEASFAISDVTQAEGDGSTTSYSFTVTRTGGASYNSTVDFETQDGTATTADNDYQAQSGTLNFGPSDTTKQITVLVNGDTKYEANEAFTVHLSNTFGGSISDSDGTGTVTNDDSAPAFSIDDVTHDEGNAGTTSYTFTVTRTGETAFGSGVSFQTQDGTATLADNDYRTQSGTLSFSTSDVSKQITVLVPGDTKFEANETFTINLSGPTNGTISDATGLGTITNDDTAPVFTIDDVTHDEGNADTTAYTFTVTRTGGTAFSSTVDFATQDGTATSGDSDYQTQTGTLSFNASETTKQLTVLVTGDTKYEGNEAFTVHLSNPSNATIGDADGLGTITNDDGVPSLSINDVSQAEGNSSQTAMVFTAALTNPSSQIITVHYATANGSTEPATEGASCSDGIDYVTSNGTLTFNPGETTKSISVAVCGEAIYEANETFTVALDTPTNATVSDGSGLGTITNDDTAPVFTIDDVTHDEGNAGTTAYTFTVTRTGGTAFSSTVDFATLDGTATAGDGDYQTQSGTLSFGPADTTKQFTILVTGDTKYESNEAFTVHLSNPSNATIGDADGLGTITNDDGVPSLSINDVAQAEGNSSQTAMVFTASLTNPSSQTITVHYATANGSSEPATGGASCSDGTDYVTSNGTLSFNPGETTKTISVGICGDLIYEANETFTVTLDTPTDATVSDATGLGTITNDDTAPVFTIDDVTHDEGNTGSTVYTFTVTRTGGTAFSSTVDFVTQDGTATGADSDYQTQTGTLSFNSSETSKQLTVLVIGDTKYESNEAFTVHLSNPSNATIGDADGLGTITNDDSVPSLSINDVSQAEGNSSQTAMVFTASLTNPSSQTVTVHYATANGSSEPATGGASCSDGIDYVTSNGTLSFNPGETTKTINVPVCGEVIYEANETFTVTLDTPTNATVSDGSGLGTITNDDSAPVFTIDDVTHDEGNAATTAYTFTVTRAGGTAFSSTVDFATQDGTATSADSDYQTQTGTLSFNASETSKQLTVLVIGDTKYESNETFTVHLSNASNATIGDADGLGTITNDDSVPSLSINDVSQAEGNSSQTAMVFTASLSNPSSQTITVHYATANGVTDGATGGSTCSEGIDYVTTSGGLTFTPGDLNKTISVAVCGEAIYEANETFTVTLDTPTNATVSDGSGLGTITNDDSAPVFTIDDVTHDEGNTGSTTYTFTVTRTGGTAFSSTVDWGTQDGTATAGDSDYQTQTGTLSFNASETTKQLTVSVTGDTKYEGNETFTVHLSNPSNATIGDADGLGTINNDDSVPSLSINDVTQAEGNSSQTAMVFTASLTNPSSQIIAVHYATANGSSEPATGGASCTDGIDYVTSNGTLTFNPGETTKTINVAVCGEAIYEPNETFTITLDTPTNATVSDATGLGTITNDDTAPVFTVDDVAHDEGNAGTTAYTFTVTRTGGTAFSSTIDFATQDGTATAVDSDYQTQTGTLSFNASETSKQLTVSVTGDTKYEGNEAFTVHLSNPSNATIGDADGLGTITNDDTDVSLAVTPSAVAEDGATNLIYTFTRNGVTTVALTVNFSVAGSATLGSDYMQTGATTFDPSSGTVTFDAGNSTATVTIDPSADPIVESDEDVILTLTAGAGYNVSSPASATGTITNDEGCPSSLIVNDLGDTVDANPADGACLDAAGKCTLRAAITEANALTTCGSIAISFSISGTIQLNNGELTIDHDLIINGGTTSELVINGNNASRVLTVNVGRSVRVSDLTISGGNASGDDGGGIKNNGTLTLTGVTLSGDAAANGGAIHNAGTLTCTNTTVSGNFATANGGGIFTAGTATLTNVTVTNNRTDNDGDAAGSGGGLSIASGPITLRNTIVARNFRGASPGTTADEVSGILDSATSYNNLIGDGEGMTGVSDGLNGNHVGSAIAPIDPRLSLLESHGGGTQTHALLAGSPALDAGENSFVVSPLFSGPPFTDQRGSGFARIAQGPGGISTVDIGAFEAHPSITDISDKSVNEGVSIDVPFGVGDTSLGISSINAISDNTTLVQSITVNNATTASPDLSIVLNSDQSGQATITVTVNGTNGQSVSDTFRLTVNAVNDAPNFTKGADQIVGEDSGPQAIANWATGISAGPNEAGQALSFQVTGNSNPGLFLVAPAVSSAGTLTYTPAANVSGSATITLVLKDDGGTVNGGQDTSAAQSFTITVNSINDAPSFTKGADQTVVEDSGPQTVTNWATAISAGPNEAGQTLSFQITGNSNPALFATMPAVSSAGTLTYTPAVNANGDAAITLVLKDDGGTANGGQDTSAAQSFIITVNTVNDAPSFTKGADQTVGEDSGLQTVNNWATGMSAGPNEAGQTLSFQVTGNSNPVLFSTAPAVTSTGTLTYTPAANANGSATIGLTLKDNGGTANGGQDTSAPQSFSITVSAINDAPSFTKGADQTVGEDAGPQTVTNWATGISAGPSEAGQALSFQITGNSNPALFATAPAVNAAGTLTYAAAANANGSATITLVLKDDGGTANGGQDTSATQTFTITVNAIDDAPSFTKGADQTIAEDAGPQTVTNWATGISAGPNESGQALLFQITGNSNPALFATPPAVSAAGTLTYTPTANASGNATITLVLKDDGGTANGGQDTSPTQTFSITVNAVNDAPSFTKGADQSASEDAGLQTVTNWATGISAGPNEAGQALSFQITGNNNPGLFATAPAVNTAGTLTYTPAANANGSATISLILKDDGGTANGGQDTSAAQSFKVTVNAINDAPSFTKGADQTVAEDSGPQTVNNWATGISAGPNESGQALSFQVTANSNPGLFATAPAVTSTGTLTYTPAANANGSATITLALKDDGGTVNGGQDTSAVQSFSITVNAVNDAPVNSVPGRQETNENTPLVLCAGDRNRISVSDVDAGENNVQVNLSVTRGTLTLGTTAGVTLITGDGVDDVSMTFTGTIANINLALEGLKFKPEDGFSGTAALQITTDDLEQCGSGGAQTATDSIPIAVNFVGGQFQFANSTYIVTEGDKVDVTITRTGDRAGAASVSFATSDSAAAQNCNVVNGTASSRCDYETRLATVRFAPGETAKTISIFVVDDSYLEGPETFSITLGNAVGASLAPNSTATVTITDNDLANGPNPLDDAQSFVRQHYLDFLNREPDAAGLQFWTNEITSCGSDTQCTEVKRLNVSAAFFLSIEFQETGYLIERIYKSSFGDTTGSSSIGGTHQLSVPIIRLNEFLSDTQEIDKDVIVGQTNWQQQLETNKQSFIAEFVQRERFTNAFPTSMAPAQFVDKLFLNAGVTPTTAERQTAIGRFGSATDTSDLAARALALRDIAENSTFKLEEMNRAFVLMEYFGYLRRNSDDPQDSDYTGYDFWLSKLNQFNGNYLNAEMVKAFITSTEYRQRLGR